MNRLIEKNPKVSIITVVYNGQETITSTINSIINQTFKDYEYIVIDGFSNDSTMDIVNSFKEFIDVVICEPDKGIFDAMNKGLKIARGEWVLFINSGDLLFDSNILGSIFKLKVNFDEYNLLYGDVILYDTTNNYIFRSSTSALKLNLNAICHQSVLIRKSEHDLFDIKFKLSADHKIIYNLFRTGKAYYIRKVISRILIGGVSANLFKTRNEKFLISFKCGNLVDIICAIIFYIYGSTKHIIKLILVYCFPKSIFYFFRNIKNLFESGFNR